MYVIIWGGFQLKELTQAKKLTYLNALDSPESDPAGALDPLWLLLPPTCSPLSGVPKYIPRSSQSRGPLTCWSKSSIDLKQLWAVRTLYSYLGGVAAVRKSVGHETWLCLCAWLRTQALTSLIHQPSALSLALLRGKTKGWAGWNNSFFSGWFFSATPKASLLGFQGGRGGENKW